MIFKNKKLQIGRLCTEESDLIKKLFGIFIKNLDYYEWKTKRRAKYSEQEGKEIRVETIERFSCNGWSGN